MKKTFKTLVVALPLILLTPGCQKDNIDINEVKTECQSDTSKVFYSVDGQSMSLIVASEEAWQSFLHQMVCLAEEGHSVTFRLGSTTIRQGLSKEKLTYVTPSQSDAETWCAHKAKDGYEVTMIYDPVDKVYICTAIK